MVVFVKKKKKTGVRIRKNSWYPYLETATGAILGHYTDVRGFGASTDEAIQIIMPEISNLKAGRIRLKNVGYKVLTQMLLSVLVYNVSCL